jgi:hypothetical protein
VAQAGTRRRPGEYFVCFVSDDALQPEIMQQELAPVAARMREVVSRNGDQAFPEEDDVLRSLPIATTSVSALICGCISAVVRGIARIKEMAEWQVRDREEQGRSGTSGERLRR